MAERAPFSPDAASAGRRALANVALDLTTGNRDPEAVADVAARFHAADNMTDRSAALATLALGGFEERLGALEAFYDRYRNDHLVLDKWFMLQAMVPLPATLDEVERLQDHPAYVRTNPNRIRSLVGGFAGGNQTQFNRADGAGYDFVAQFILDLDRRNPQTAARLLTHFRSWRALEPGRRLRAEAALRRIAEAPGLSPDTGDIITRTLA
jgi:aminopeptidase N